MSEIPDWFVSDWSNTAIRVDGVYGARFRRGNPFPGAQRDMWTLLAVTEGSLRVRQGAWTADLNPGDQVLLRPNTAFTRQVLSDESHWATIDFRVEATGLGVDPLPKLALPAVVHIPLTPEWMRSYQSALSAFQKNGRDRFALDGRGLVDWIVGRYLKEGLASDSIAVTHHTHVPDWLSTTRQRIAGSFMKRNLDTAKIASEAGFSRFHFCREFKKAFHVTPMAFLWEQRLQVASRTMDDDPFLPLREIACKCGFANQTHFSRLFRKRFGMPPRQWRQRNLNAPPVPPPVAVKPRRRRRGHRRLPTLP